MQTTAPLGYPELVSAAAMMEKLALQALDEGGVTFSATAATAGKGGSCIRDSGPRIASPGVTPGILTEQILLSPSRLHAPTEPAVLGPPAGEKPGMRSLGSAGAQIPGAEHRGQVRAGHRHLQGTSWPQPTCLLSAASGPDSAVLQGYLPQATLLKDLPRSTETAHREQVSEGQAV